MGGEPRKRDCCKHSTQHEEAQTRRVRGRFTLCGCGACVGKLLLLRRICVCRECTRVLQRVILRCQPARRAQADEQSGADKRRQHEAENARDELLSSP